MPTSLGRPAVGHQQPVANMLPPVDAKDRGESALGTLIRQIEIASRKRIVVVPMHMAEGIVQYSKKAKEARSNSKTALQSDKKAATSADIAKENERLQRQKEARVRP
ncbi:MAG: hypothetical protein Q9169_003727 [Polycauliona sp. 2 TL-2023]